MTNRRRNRLVRRLILVGWFAGSLTLLWVTGEAFQWRGRFWGLAVGLVIFWGALIVTGRRGTAELDTLEAELAARGQQPADEPQIRLRLAHDRESLVAGVVALALIAAVVAACFAGWLRRFGLLTRD